MGNSLATAKRKYDSVIQSQQLTARQHLWSAATSRSFWFETKAVTSHRTPYRKSLSVASWDSAVA
jgi:hypothetical protein